MSTTDRISKEILLRAPVERAWRAVSRAEEFGVWFGVEFEAPFEPGRAARGKIRPTLVDAHVARLQAPYAGMPFDITIVEMEAPHRFAFRWHPYNVDPPADRTAEPTTLVVFELSETPEGTRLCITESGFDQLPEPRRTQAFTANEGGWTHQGNLLSAYVHTYAP